MGRLRLLVLGQHLLHDCASRRLAAATGGTRRIGRIELHPALVHSRSESGAESTDVGLEATERPLQSGALRGRREPDCGAHFLTVLVCRGLCCVKVRFPGVGWGRERLDRNGNKEEGSGRNINAERKLGEKGTMAEGGEWIKRTRTNSAMPILEQTS